MANPSTRMLSGLAGLMACLTCPLLHPASAETVRQKELRQTLETYSREVRAPAWAAAVVSRGEIAAVAGVGVRDIDSGTPLAVESDQFHWGSVSKSVTATMIAGVAKEGALSFATTLAEALPQVPMRPEYRNVTIAQLLDHRADLPAYTRLGPAEAQRFQRYAGTASERRGAFVREVLQEPPPPRADQALVYSNAGPVIAAYAAEMATGSTWEALVRKHVFDRIGMTSAGFGLPAGFAPDQTRGHAGPGPDDLVVMDARPPPGSPLLDPSGNIRSTVRDLAAYARAHLLALQGAGGPLAGLDVRALHTPPDDGRTIGPERGLYAMGWGLRREGGQLVHWHNGSAGQYYAQVELYPDDDLAIVVLCNAGFPGRSAPELIRRIRSLYVN